MPPPDPLLLTAYAAQATHVQAWLAGLTAADLAAPSRLPGWTVGVLAAHLVASGRPFSEAPRAPRGTRPMTVGAYLAGYGPVAAAITGRDTSAAAGLTACAAAQAFSAVAADVHRVAAALTDDPVLAASRGPVRAGDLLRTRVLELVVHALDVDGGWPLDRQAVRVSVRLLAQVLGERHGGKAVEVRVPPYAAVQIGAGVTHTRGTPPNVVECGPEVFVALASGRRAWADVVAAGEIRASGARADLRDYLPLL